ncbi:MAG: ATP-binding protein [Promethearchaeota archaeon]
MLLDLSSEEPVGFIVDEGKATSFVFASDRKRYPPKFEYLTVRSEEFVGDKLEPVDVLAQVERISSLSLALRRDLDIEAIHRIKEAGIDDVKTWGSARILGYLVTSSKGAAPKVLIPRRAVTPGQPIYIAPDHFLKKFYEYPSEEALYIGNLITRPKVPAHISINGFRRHLAILAQTGAGKSYLTGVLVEELMAHGATVLIVDPHADYVLLSQTTTGGRHEFSERVSVFQNPESTSRYSQKDIGRVESYTVKLADVPFEELCNICGIGKGYTNIRDALHRALERLKKQGIVYLVEDIEESLKSIAQDEELERTVRQSAQASLKYIRKLRRLRVFSRSGVPIENILKPCQTSVIDLSGLESYSTDYIVSRLLSDAFSAVASGSFDFPVFLVVEEAHNFIPAGDETRSLSVIRRIAGEGRKFGIFLIVISQRPGKIHSDTLSQCNSQIVLKITNPQDQTAIANSSERLSEDLVSDLPGLNVGEAVIVGEVTRSPVMIRVRTRRTKEGGADIDVVSRLRKARKAAGIDEQLAKERRQQTRMKGRFSEV